MENGQNIFKPVFPESEIVFGLVGAVGTDLDRVCDHLEKSLKDGFKYTVDRISVSQQILSKFLSSAELAELEKSQYQRIDRYMDIGTELRKTHNGFLAMAIANLISQKRQYGRDNQPVTRHAYIVKSLKHAEEVNILRNIYGNGFYLIGVYESSTKRLKNLKGIRYIKENAEKLIEKDEAEEMKHGQQTRDTFQLADFFIENSDDAKAQAYISRIVGLVFGDPFATPTFGEYAMFMAYCASLRSADLSRQTGAVVCKNNEILATGANDCPSFGGGLHWYAFNARTNTYEDCPQGRDYTRGYDTNKREFVTIAKEILDEFKIPSTLANIEKIKRTQLGDLTEYGRVVHAEMEALAVCARNNISSRNAELYATTFPCHNCAKHIIAAGIRQVVYIEPYPKSKTFEFYSESITQNEAEVNKVLFIPFFGVGPRRFIELFAMNANFLPNKIRKKNLGDCSPNEYPDEYGKKVEWERDSDTKLHSQMMPTTYLDRELDYSEYYNKFIVNSQGKLYKNLNPQAITEAEERLKYILEQKKSWPEWKKTYGSYRLYQEKNPQKNSRKTGGLDKFFHESI
ncbi:MAG: dCMP deaminase family protein [Firmicutes bacterium]|nr:dCMP deaminase family protein [Bacillota bacterium]